jgi:hypothetical protein
MDKDDETRMKPVVDITRTAASPPESTNHLTRPWSRLASQLVPLIGESGFCALFSRTIRLAGQLNGSFVVDPSSRAVDKVLSVLAGYLATLDGASARAANSELLDTFIKLLSALIGEGLTTRLLASASNNDDDRACVQEHK